MEGPLRWLIVGINFLMTVTGAHSIQLASHGCISNVTTCCTTNDTAISFDPTRYICCQGKLNLRTSPDYLYCCGNQPYSPASSICCKRNLTYFDINVTKPKCCGRVGYDAEKSFCCQGVVRKKSVDNPACCAGNVYDITKATCCQGIVRLATEGRSSCCGNTSYNHHKDTCCQGTVYSNTVTKNCCGTQLFDPSLSTCCHGRLTSKSGLSCCGKHTYNVTTHLCCNKKIKVRKSIKSQCCCSDDKCTLYDTAKQICCGGKTVVKQRHLGCCGNDIYDVTRQECCGTIPLGANTPGNWRCCGGKPYNEDHQICCNDNIHPRESTLARCCGNQVYEPSRFHCEDSLFSRVTPVKGDYCENKPYNPNHEICCKNTLYSKRYGHFSLCCGSDVYHRQRNICCRGKLARVPKGLPQCCRDQPINIFEQKCDVITGDVTSRSSPHVSYCGDRMVAYDSRKSRCCGDVIYGDGYICCEGKVMRLPGKHIGSFKCCGTKPYNESFICCHGNIVSKHQGTHCCERTGYNASTHACCQGHVFSPGFTCCKGVVHATPGTGLKAGKCCGGIGYNDQTQICCADMVFPKKSVETKCCGDRPYDPSRNLHTCCHARLSLKRHANSICCGKKAYNPNIDSCCRGRLHTGQKQPCCGKNVYNATKEICCRRIIYPLRNYGSKCCKKVAFNQTTQLCRFGKVVPKELCGRRYYDDVTYVCCSQRLYVESRDFKCCGQTYYNTLVSMCCGDRVYSRSTVCCNGKVYSGNVGCCGASIFRKNSLLQCCTGKIYNKIKFRCKNGRIVSSRLKRKLCDDRNVVFVGQVSSVIKHSLIITNILKGSDLQKDKEISLPSKQLKRRRISLEKGGKTYMVIARMENKSTSTIKHIKLCQLLDENLRVKTVAILKSCRRNPFELSVSAMKTTLSLSRH